MVHPLLSVSVVMVDVIAGRMHPVCQSRAQLSVCCVVRIAVARSSRSIAVLCTLCMPNIFF